MFVIYNHLSIQFVRTSKFYVSSFACLAAWFTVDRTD